MVTYIRRWSFGIVAAGLAVATMPAFADDTEGVVRLGHSSPSGVVRISDDTSQEAVVRGQSNCPECEQNMHYESGPVYYGEPCRGSGRCNNRLAQWMRQNAASYRTRNRIASANLNRAVEEDCQEKHQWARCKFGFLVPTGCGGAGCPPVGHYNMVYPVNPNYFDQRDGNVYAAAGYGGPVSVPLAPNVGHTYNYGWGIPSSRLTPVSRPGPQFAP